MNEEVPAMALQPETPEEAGVEERSLDPSHVEGAHLLMDQSKERLEKYGFTPAEILDWAEEYLAFERTGDVDAFVGWIEEKEAAGAGGSTDRPR
jgi:hypothetical protein